MAAEKGKTPGKAARRTTGKGPQSRASKGAKPAKAPAAKSADVSNRSRSRAATKAEVPGAVEAAQAAATERITHITCHQSMFQLRAEREDVVNGTVVPQPEWVLDFGTKGFVVADEETVDAVEKVLAGEWKDGRVSGAHFQRIAKKAGLAIVQHGLASPPLPTWDRLADDRVVPVAFEAGALSTPEKVVQAIRYENESPERNPARAPRARVLSDLAEVEAVVKAVDARGTAAAASPATSGSSIVTPQAAL